MSPATTPKVRWTAINRGAVLHMLGLNFVRERVMRRHYGFVTAIPFKEIYHPPSFKEKSLEGTFQCVSVMQWYANKVHFL